MKLKACIILIFFGITLLSQNDSSLYVEALCNEGIQIYGFDAEGTCLLLTKGLDCSKRNNYMLLQTRGEALQIDCLDFDAYHEDSKSKKPSKEISFLEEEVLRSLVHF